MIEDINVTLLEPNVAKQLSFQIPNTGCIHVEIKSLYNISVYVYEKEIVGMKDYIQKYNPKSVHDIYIHGKPSSVYRLLIHSEYENQDKYNPVAYLGLDK